MSSANTTKEALPEVSEHDNTTTPSDEALEKVADEAGRGNTVAPSEINASSLRLLLSAFCIMFCALGMINAFGVFEAYYLDDLLRDENASAISWLGSLPIFFAFSSSIVVSMLIMKYDPRILVGIGSILFLLGVFLASICTKYWQLILTQGLLIGLGDAFLISPAIICTTLAFQNNRALALGFTIAGSSIGGVIWPIALGKLLVEVGFGSTMRIAGYISIPLLVIATSCIHMPKKNTPAGTPSVPPPKPNLASILKNRRFLVLALGGWFSYLGLFTGLFFVVAYAESKGMSTTLAFYLPSITNAASFFGRVLPGFLADRYGAFNLYIIAGVSSGIITACLTTATSTAGIVVFAAAYGFASGAVLSLFGACLASILPREVFGPGLGIFMFVLSTAGLIGNPISGQVLDHSGYLALSLFSGLCLIAAGVIFLVVRLMLSRKLWSKV